ncbi:unnamed protein product [Lymnaea stagnalis]|uniref:Proteasome assembly chaperone 1 n=1 Tax=Lymnaea stagnalis TaxID=6523 RepID=A0AAV2HD31_LYMST
MATFFGEVLDVRSRAVDDDEDEDELLKNLSEPVILWSKEIQEELEKSQDKKFSCSNCVIAYGIEANAFTDIYITQKGYKKIGGIFPSVQDDETWASLKASSRDKSCFLYQSLNDPSVLVCQCNRDVLPEESFWWAKLFIDKLNLSSANITILATSSTGTYCSDTPASELETPFLRALKTDKFDGTLACQTLEQPNLLTGFPAMLMTFFQIHQQKAVIYVCYTETKYMNIMDVKTFVPVSNVSPIKDIAAVSSPATNKDKLIRDLVERHTVHDTMYM